MNKETYIEKWLSCIGLYSPKTPSNIWSVLRASGIYDSSFIAVQNGRYKKTGTDTNKEYRRTPLFHVEDLKDVIPYWCIPVAIEITEDANSIVWYEHHKSAYYIFWPEDWSIPNSILDWCVDKIYIPWNYCMNLAATVNVVLYDRMYKGMTKREALSKSLHYDWRGKWHGWTLY